MITHSCWNIKVRYGQSQRINKVIRVYLLWAMNVCKSFLATHPLAVIRTMLLLHIQNWMKKTKTITNVYLIHYFGWCWSGEKPWSSSVAPVPSMWQPAAPQCNCCFVEVPPDPPMSEPAATQDTCMLASVRYHTATWASFQSPVTVPVTLPTRLIPS